MDESRQRKLVNALRKNGELVNEVGEQYWHEKDPYREDIATW